MKFDLNVMPLDETLPI